MVRVPQPQMPRRSFRQGPQQPQPMLPRPRRPRPRRLNLWQRFQWAWILVPALIVLAAWIATGLEPSVNFEDIARLLGVTHIDRYARLALLGLLVVAIVAIAKILREQRRDRK